MQYIYAEFGQKKKAIWTHLPFSKTLKIFSGTKGDKKQNKVYYRFIHKYI